MATFTELIEQLLDESRKDGARTPIGFKQLYMTMFKIRCETAREMFKLMEGLELNEEQLTKVKIYLNTMDFDSIKDNH